MRLWNHGAMPPKRHLRVCGQKGHQSQSTRHRYKVSDLVKHRCPSVLNLFHWIVRFIHGDSRSLMWTTRTGFNSSSIPFSRSTWWPSVIWQTTRNKISWLFNALSCSWRAFALIESNPPTLSALDEKIKNLRADRRYPLQSADPPYSEEYFK